MTQIATNSKNQCELLTSILDTLSRLDMKTTVGDDATESRNTKLATIFNDYWGKYIISSFGLRESKITDTSIRTKYHIETNKRAMICEVDFCIKNNITVGNIVFGALTD